MNKSEVIKLLRTYHQETGHVGISNYSVWAKGRAPAAQTVSKLFGSWAEALDAARLPRSKRTRPKDTYRSRWSDEDMLKWVRKADVDSYAELERKLTQYRSRGYKAPSAILVRQRFGKWSEIKERAYGRGQS